ncbi:MAG: DUF5060 domain-containing protein, partial [Candidatus Eisenbacteria bacterium]|nr:DUF5060 domain-containing protein [Candidatus Latescibacterota bacterium]MBD3302007.1 DUF5060 domain-containing protein [Candidatus Eisenbacteria bacterium]
VLWTFVSPTGIRHEVPAGYDGGNRWSVRFVPDEIGRWRVSWTQEFTEKPYRSEVGVFDVVGGDLDDLLGRLEEFHEEVRGLQEDRGSSTLVPYMIRFAKLERAILQRMTPSRYGGEEGKEIRSALRAVRTALGGDAVPDPIPLVADSPPRWARQSED